MRIYIACPYTKGDVAVNVRNCIQAADAIAMAGHIPFAPLLFHFWHMQHPHSYEFWIKQSMEWLFVCDCVIRLPGDSDGAEKECLRANAIGIPVFKSINEALSWLSSSLQQDQPTPR